VSGSQLERIMQAGPALSQGQGLPTQQPLIDETFNAEGGASGLSKVVFGTMLAQIAVIPREGIDRVYLRGFGDPEMLKSLKGRIVGNTLTIEGELPFKPGSHPSSGTSFGSGRFQSNVFSSMGNVTIVNGTVSGGSFSSDGGYTVSIDGREVDLERIIQLAVMVPVNSSIQIRKTIGAIGVSGVLGGQLSIKASGFTNVFANEVGSFKGSFSGSVQSEITTVRGDFDTDMSGSGRVVAGSVGGKVSVDTSGSAQVVINGGTSRSAKVDISGNGTMVHRGTVTGDVEVDISGSARVFIAAAQGEVDVDISGSGQANVNGQTYQMRRRW
jgi:hypothetical protein